jgi:DNA-binding beta-propeller fold protein YncE
VEPLGIALTPNGRTLLVTSSATGQLIAFDARSLSVHFRVDTSAEWPAAVTVHPDGRRAFVSHFYSGDIDVVDLQRQRRIAGLSLPTNDTGLPGRLMHRPQSPREPNLALSLTVSPGGKRLFVAHTMVDTGAARTAGVGISTGGYGLGGETPIVATVATFDLEQGTLIRPAVQSGNRIAGGFGQVNAQDLQVQMLAQPMAVVHDPKHARLLLVAMGSDRVMALDSRASDPITRPMGVFTVGQAPKGVAVSSDGSQAFVHNAHSYNVSTVSLRDNMNTTNRNRWDLPSQELGTIGRNALPASATRGRRLFTFNLDNRIGGSSRFACASCHPDGRHDGRVWQIGAGPRQTPILASRLEGTGPFNWLGTEEQLEDNIVKTVHRLGGTGITEQDAADLAEYMTRYMPGLDNPNRGQNRPLVAEGRRIFEDDTAGCSGCHDARRGFSDGQRHEVGTTTAREFDLWRRFGQTQRPGGPRPPSSVPQAENTLQDPRSRPNGMPIMPPEAVPEAPVAYDTPSLRHLWASGPYYHDGSVRSIRELITTGNPNDRMGHTSHLSARQLDALEAYLKSL